MTPGTPVTVQPTLDDLYCPECSEFTADPRLGVCHDCVRASVDVDRAVILERLRRYCGGVE